MNKKLRLLFTFFLACTLGACTIVEISGDDDSVQVERSFGFASVNFSGEATLAAAKVRSLGVSSGPLGYSIGLSSRQFALSDGSCGLIVWVDETVQSEKLLADLAALGNVCVVE